MRVWTSWIWRQWKIVCSFSFLFLVSSLLWGELHTTVMIVFIHQESFKKKSCHQPEGVHPLSGGYLNVPGILKSVKPIRLGPLPHSAQPTWSTEETQFKCQLLTRSGLSFHRWWTSFGSIPFDYPRSTGLGIWRDYFQVVSYLSTGRLRCHYIYLSSDSTKFHSMM